eukprot:gene31371-40757_t
MTTVKRRSNNIKSRVPLGCPWVHAFGRAQQVESEGAKEFEDLFVIGKRSFKQSAESFDHRQQDQGAFSQPKQLADFVQTILNEMEEDDGTKDTPLQSLAQEDHVVPIAQVNSSISSNINSSSGNESNSNSNSGGSLQQICRRWLKHTYLGIGEPCVSAVCQRLHEVIGKPERLYSDYSFKGLNSKQQKAILNQLKGKPDDDC